MKRVFLGMSGGVDSSVSAILLKEQGYDVTGIYMKNWSKDLPGMKCPWAEDLADAKRVAVQLDLDFEVWDFEQDYKAKVVDYMLSEFEKGRTPNPDVICNELIKFKLFYETALQRGADFIATGHYARIENGKADDMSKGDAFFRTYGASEEHVLQKSDEVAFVKGCDEETERVRDGSTSVTTEVENGVSEKWIRPYSFLLRSIDENKDQTYFLYRMSDEATSRTLFPVGNLTKPEVKQIAARHGLDVATKKESMGVCFVGEVGMKDFLREYLAPQPGEIREIETDNVLGYHDGVIFYTIGQRHGLYLGGGLPYYVVKKDLKSNIVYVSKNLNQECLWTKELKLEDLHLRNRISTDQLEQIPNLKVRLRHRAPLIDAKFKDNTIIFSESIKRPAAGQSAVFYSDEICLGGGIIAE